MSGSLPAHDPTAVPQDAHTEWPQGCSIHSMGGDRCSGAEWRVLELQWSAGTSCLLAAGQGLICILALLVAAANLQKSCF